MDHGGEQNGEICLVTWRRLTRHNNNHNTKRSFVTSSIVKIIKGLEISGKNQFPIQIMKSSISQTLDGEQNVFRSSKHIQIEILPAVDMRTT